jgi:formylglycine-generating enzyme required for sulfatase activity
MESRVIALIFCMAFLGMGLSSCKDNPNKKQVWSATCPDGTVCTNGKSCVAGDCIVLCGDNQCANIFGESCYTCPEDCGSCCGNGICDAGEPDGGCPGDCEGWVREEFNVTDGFVLIEAGSYWMGSPCGQDCPVGYTGAGCLGDGTGTTVAESCSDVDNLDYDIETLDYVHLTRDFEMQIHEVTQAEWKAAFNGWNPSGFPDCGDNCPIESISGYDALAFANWKSEQAGLGSCYSFSHVKCKEGGEPVDDANHKFCLDAKHGGIDSATVCFSEKVNAAKECNGYRLPTEAEWEYGARAGTLTAYYDGKEYSSDDCGCAGSSCHLNDIAWYCGNNNPEGSKPVGVKEANAWGLHDMIGNVEELCLFSRNFSPHHSSPCCRVGSPAVDPVKWGCSRIARKGGNWSSNSNECRSAYIASSVPIVERSSLRGFRLVRSRLSGWCGDGICGVQDKEDCTTCPIDCGNCCSNGICDPSETCCTCPVDCGSCAGNGFCDCGETKQNNPDDCPANVTEGFVRIPAGSFWMGVPKLGEDCPLGYTGAGCKGDGSGITKIPGYLGSTLRYVTLTHDFEMQIHEVTQGEWKEAFDGWNPSYNSGCGDDCPVESIEYKYALEFANWKSEQVGIEPCYIIKASYSEPARFPTNVAKPYDCEGYRLPTEAEWEYAARAESLTFFYPSNGNNGSFRWNGCRDENLDRIGWFFRSWHRYSYGLDSGALLGCEKGTSTTHPVGQKDANAWGLYDMLGNVAEWTWDRYCDEYLDPTLSESAVDPAIDSCDYKIGPNAWTSWVVKGGSIDDVGFSFSRERLPRNPQLFSHGWEKYTGFRLTRTLQN